jgi:hypothetical protein
MRSFITTILAITLSFSSFSQNLFVRGYYIDNHGRKSEGLIYDKRWNNYPLKIQFKTSGSENAIVLGIDSVSEFGIGNELRYVRKTVNIDRSGVLLNDLDSIREPVFTSEKLFVRLLVSGKHRLYDYRSKNQEKYFIESDTFPITQLIYKKFLTDDLVVGTNRDYQKQLWKYMNCPSVNMQELSQLNYFRKELVSVVMRFNECDKVEAVNLSRPAPYDKFFLTIKGGAGYSDFGVYGLGNYDYDIDFGYLLTPHLGIEAEYLLPFSTRKWGLTAEIGLLNYKSAGKERDFSATIDYTSLEVPVGIRYHTYPGRKAELFFSAYYFVNHPLRLEIDYNINIEMIMKSNNNLGLGMGFRYNKRISAECRVMWARHMPGKADSWYSEFRDFSFLIGYTLF